MPVLRPAREEDLDALAAIEKLWPTAPGWSRAQFAEELGRAGSVLLVADDGGAVGYACMWLVAGEAQVLNIAVAPAAARRGVGRALLAALLERARGAARATLEVSEPNLAARRLYEGAGFRVVGRRAKYYNDGSDAILMDKDLSCPT
ncbi:MAG TPA: ribosomal protein S18-alanine N-acetyltransferase [Elusimicrobiota bacterium]|jgi:ribosomal-protein-alanine acetyltransferase|nr:ribosomal protein S18-alanine N-acetyltransferase [Elusimicrobiota bacterium]